MDMIQKMKEYIKSILESPEKIKQLAKKGKLNCENMEELTDGGVVIRDNKIMTVKSIAAFLEDSNNGIIAVTMQPRNEKILIVTKSGIMRSHNINLNGMCINNDFIKRNAINISEDCKKILESKQKENFTTKIKQKFKIKEKFIKGKSNKKAIKNILIIALKEIEDLEKTKKKHEQEKDKEKLEFTEADSETAKKAAKNQIQNESKECERE